MLVGLFMLGLGLAGLHFVKRRRFYRTNAAGTEQFKNYGSMAVTNFFEAIITFVSVILMGASVFAMVYL